MKKFAVLILLICPLLVMGQAVAINTDASLPHGSAILDIKSDLKGLLVPRMSTIQRGTIPGPAIGLTVFDTDTYSYWMYRGDINGGWAEIQHHYQNHWSSSGLNIYSNNNNGNVGIGTNNPTEKLSINGTNPVISLSNATVPKGFLEVSGDLLRLGTYNSNANGGIQFETKNLTRMSILSTGFVGIGINSPVSKFQIINGADAGLNTHGYMMLGATGTGNLVFDNDEIMARNNGNSANLTLQNGSGNVYIGDPTQFNSFHKLGVDGNTVITGALRIGATVNPSGYKLAVDGKVICTELMVRLVPNWPDYVFNKDHKLPTIEEVEAYIAKHHHLPGIPAAKEIEASGLNIGEMQKLQMEKIEELTLYVIELKKEIEKLKQRL